MHERLGFTYSGSIKKAGFKFGKWLDLVFYQKNLSGPENPMDG
jgi:phosphinothricin acetyltransferase